MKAAICIEWLADSLARSEHVSPSDFEAAHAVMAESAGEDAAVIHVLLSTIDLAQRGEVEPAEPRTEAEARATAAALRVASAPEPERTPALRRVVNALWAARDGGPMPRIRPVWRAASAEDRYYLDQLSNAAEATRRVA